MLCQAPVRVAATVSGQNQVSLASQVSRFSLNADIITTLSEYDMILQVIIPHSFKLNICGTQ
jgi:hypothetical protein